MAVIITYITLSSDVCNVCQRPDTYFSSYILVIFYNAFKENFFVGFFLQ